MIYRLGKQQDLDLTSQGPSGQGSVAGKQLWGEGGGQHSPGRRAQRAWAASGACQSSLSPTPGQCPPSPLEPRPPTVPLFSLPGWEAEGLSGTTASSPHHSPPTTITVEGSRVGRGQRVPQSPFHPGTSGPFPPFVTQFGSITLALALSHVPRPEVMDSTAGESSPVGRGVGGLLAQLHGVGRARGFLSQRPIRRLVWGPLPAGFALLPSSLPGC